MIQLGHSTAPYDLVSAGLVALWAAGSDRSDLLGSCGIPAKIGLGVAFAAYTSHVLVMTQSSRSHRRLHSP